MAVGFEFQTGVKVWRIPSKIERMVCDCKTYRDRVECIRVITAGRPDEQYDSPAGQLTYFPKNFTLHDGGIFKVVTDGQDIEFVTTPVSIGAPSRNEVIAFPETIRTQAEKLTEFVRMLDGVRRDVNAWRNSDGVNARSIWVCRRDDRALFSQFSPFVLQFFKMFFYDYRDDSIAGFAQITGGVRITRIRKLFRILAQSQVKAQSSGKAFLGSRDAESYARFLSKTVETLRTSMIVDSNWKNYPAFKDHKASNELRGLVTLATMYVLKGAGGEGSQINVVKNLFFIMSRTDFGKLFSLIPQKERDHYAAHPDDWVNFICKDMMSIVFGRAVNPDNRLIKQTVTDYKSLETPAKIPITRREWLTAMAEQKRDLLSTAAHPKLGEGGKQGDWWVDAHGGHRLRGTGELGDKTDAIVVGDLEQPAPIFEFRGPGNPNDTMVYSAWRDYIFNAYKFLATLNIHAKSEAINESSIWSS